MAVTADTVQARLEVANLPKYTRDLGAASQAFTAMSNSAVSNAGVAGNAIDQLNAKVQGMNTANIAAQFQDIGVTAAAGMNPLIIALQQGTQLSAVLNAEVAKGVSPVKALGAAFVQIINPMSLATIAAVALGAAVLQGIGQIVPKTEAANDAIKRHRTELEGIVRGYKGAEEAVNSYFDQVERLPKNVAAIQTREQFAEMADDVDNFTERAKLVSETLLGFGDPGSSAERSLVNLTREFANGDISAEKFYLGLQDVRGELNAVENAMGFLPGSIGNLIAEMEDGALKAIAFGDALNQLVAASFQLSGIAVDVDLQNALDLKTYIAEQERLNSLSSDQLAIEREKARIMADAGQFGITEEKALQLAQETLAAEKARADLKKSGKSAATEYERERKAVEELLASMSLEAAMLGQTNREKAIAIALSRANASATEEERDAIAQTAGFIYDTEQALKTLNDTSTEWANTIQSATRGFIDDLIEGKSAAEAFSNVLSSVASKLLDVGLSNLFGSSGFNIAGLFGGFRAQGGPVTGGTSYIVGEEGPELFTPSTSGNITPNHAMGGSSVTFAPVIDARGADVAAVARLERAMQQLAGEIVPTIRKEIATGPKKGRR